MLKTPLVTTWSGLLSQKNRVRFHGGYRVSSLVVIKKKYKNTS